MVEIATVGLDLAKNWFQVHGADARGRPVLRKKLARSKVLEFFANLPPCLVGMEACGSAHHWARELIKLGHEVRLMPPQYVIRLPDDQAGLMGFGHQWKSILP